MGAHEALEHAEHAAHAGGGHGDGGGKKTSGKLLGITMALIAVLIAYCAAMVGSERNELTKSMILQTQANSNYTSASTKFRLVMLDMEKLRGSASAPLTSPEGLARKRLISLYQDYSKERKYSKEWAESYEPMVEAHFEAAEGYEKAQLVAEIGVVLASLAVLLSSSPAWYVSIVLALLAVGQLGLTYSKTSHEASKAAAHVKEKEEAYTELRKAHSAANEDEATVEALDPGGKIRAELEAGSKGGEGEKKEAGKEEHEKKEH